jgi:hypothetical protein
MTYGVDTSILKTNTPVPVEVPAVVEVPTAPPEPVVAEPELNREYTPLEVKPTLEVPEATLESGLVPENPSTE